MNLEKSLELDVIKEQMKSFCSFSAGIKEIEELIAKGYQLDF